MGIFNSKKEEINILLKTQENIEITQKNMAVLVDKISCILERQENDEKNRKIEEVKQREIQLAKQMEIEKENIIKEEEKIRAAYALNLCTVSISQIIDYNDVNILEQEYDIILNNLNLEYMPKDEALLNTLKILLDTITFFRIQEGDKKFIDKEYQEKVKNAIWSAVPNFGLIIAGGNPWNMAISLASQVGCGYMNYRKTKAQNQLDKEKAEWELQRSAIEQFNGIRRELFDAAWRLADKYKFPDKYRLTERKIKQYNNILMDSDNYRRYDRLIVIKENFDAYPPFWYYLGNTANLISQEESDEGSKSYYKDLAKNHFEVFLQRNENALLREDQVLAACCLEYVELLDIYVDKEKIKSLLDKAVQTSGDFNDIIQLCALHYLRVGSIDNASDLLKRLVNEDYNATTNAQILSKLYVYNYINNQSSTARYDYKVLEKRIDSQFLFPMPNNRLESPVGLHKEFVEKQRKVLIKKYMLVLEVFREKYNIKFNKIFPVPDINSQYTDSYFNDDRIGYVQRIEELKRVLSHKGKAEEYKRRLSDANISFAILDILNKIFESITFLNCIEVEEDLQILVQMNIDKNKENLNELQKKINENIFEENDLKILEKLNFKSFTDLYFDEIADCVKSYINNKESMDEFCYAEQNLREFCIRERISEPDVLLKRSEHYRYLEERKHKYFEPSLLGVEAIHSNNEAECLSKMVEVVNSAKDKLIINGEKTSLFVKGDNKYDIYMNKRASKINRELRRRTIAILEDRSFNNKDIIFTRTGIVLVNFNSLKAEVSYNDIAWCDTTNDVIRIRDKYKNKNLNLPKFYELVHELAEFVEQDSISPMHKLSELY